MPAGDCLLFSDSEGISDILKTRFSGKLRLSRRIGYANERPRLKSCPRLSRDRACEERRLVVSALGQAKRMQGHGNDDIRLELRMATKAPE